MLKKSYLATYRSGTDPSITGHAMFRMYLWVSPYDRLSEYAEENNLVYTSVTRL